MMRFEEVTTDCFKELSLHMARGEVCKLIASSSHAARVIVETATGFLPPQGGKVFLFDADIYLRQEWELLRLFRRVGVVREDGGLISNLKVRENIVLPLWYHKGEVTPWVEEEAVRLFGIMGISGKDLDDYMGRLPGTLPLHEKRMVGLIRAILSGPELLIYGSVLDGLPPEAAEVILRLGAEFLSGGSGRSSLYISADEDSLSGVETEKIIRTKGKRFARWDS